MENTKKNINNKTENTGASDSSMNHIQGRASNTIPSNVKKDRPQNKNLISLADRTREERIEIGRKGGLKSAEARKTRKTLKENILSMMVQEISPDKLQAMGVDLETLNGDYTLQNAVIASLFRQAIDGDTKAAQLLRDTIDEAPTTRQEIRQEVITQDDLKTIDNLKRYLTG